MDATRTRRTKDAARQRWYSNCRCRRFARYLGFRLSATRDKRKAGPEPA